MAEQQSSRSEQLLELGQIGMRSLIREPVRESVREALAEEQMLADEKEERTRRRDDSEQSGDGSRLLRPAMLLPVLGLGAAVALSRRRRLMKLADEKGVLDQVDEAIPTHDSESSDADDSTGHEDSDDDTSNKESAELGNFDDDSGAEESGDHGAEDTAEEDDAGSKELSTPE